MAVGIAIRLARPEDAGEVLELWELAPRPHSMGTDTLDGMERLLAHAPDALLVAEASGSIVGTLIAAWDGWRGNLYRLIVTPGHRRRGIALSLVEAGERRLKARGARRINALVAAEDAVAGALWTAAGYEHDPAMGRFVRML